VQDLKVFSVDEEKPIVKSPTCKLSADQVMRVVSMIAMFYKAPEIIGTVQQEFGISIKRCTVQYYKKHPDYQKAIQKIREKWTNELDTIDIANKRRRIEELQKVYRHSFKTNQMKNALTALYQAQHEVEKELTVMGNINNTQINMYKDMTEAEIEEERAKCFERLKQIKGEISYASEIGIATPSDGDSGTQPQSTVQGE